MQTSYKPLFRLAFDAAPETSGHYPGIIQPGEDYEKKEVLAKYQNPQAIPVFPKPKKSKIWYKSTCPNQEVMSIYNATEALEEPDDSLAAKHTRQRMSSWSTPRLEIFIMTVFSLRCFLITVFSQDVTVFIIEDEVMINSEEGLEQIKEEFLKKRMESRYPGSIGPDDDPGEV
ncbi:hypothetical protein YB2330_003344 [Saitoella coloradoensis]